ncbi:MAG: flagellar basal body-associated FliL family protein [Azoarcus sp.]|jgi:flagellar FliL protein|nr:flagellar basal body-associated FliL family protein [Azoarcus sp.]
MAQPAAAASAKTPAKPEPPATEAAAPKRSGKLLLIVVLILVLVLLLAVVGVGALLVLKKGGGNNHESSEAAAAVAPPPPVAAAPSAVDLTKPPVFAALDPFTVNLRSADGEDSRYLQAVIALQVQDQITADALKGWMPRIRDRITLLLASKLPAEALNPENREEIAKEIMVQLNTLLGVPPPPPGSQTVAVGPIQAVLFNSFIVQ